MDESASQFDKLPPHDLSSEMCLLASMMLDKGVFHECRPLVERESFFQTDHQIIFEIIVDLYGARGALDSVMVRDELVRRKLLEEVGGTETLRNILSTVPSAAHGKHYAGIVAEHAMWRGLIAVSNDAIRAAYVPHKLDRAIDALQATMARLARLIGDEGASACEQLGEVAGRVYDDIADGKGLKLIPTGIGPIDRVLGGVGAGEVMVIGARPSMGKSTLGRQIVAAASFHHPTVIISNEEGREKIARNLLSAYSDVENNKLRRGSLDKVELKNLADGLARLGPLPIYIIDRAFRISSIRSALTMCVSKFGVKLAVVDYLQRIQCEGKDRFERVTNTSLELSCMFKELNIAGIVMAQLNRELTHRQDKRPTMGDLRESGQIEQDADQIIFLHREDYYRKMGEADGDMDKIAELILAKVRDGVRGDTIRMKAALRYQRFEEYDVVPEFRS